MIRIYIFIIASILLQNCCWFWHLAGCDEDYCFRIYDTCMMSQTILLPLWILAETFSPFNMAERDKTKQAWIYLIVSTYLIFQFIDIVQMRVNGNIDNSAFEFVAFISLNLMYWLIFRKK